MSRSKSVSISVSELERSQDPTQKSAGNNSLPSAVEYECPMNDNTSDRFVDELNIDGKFTRSELNANNQ